MRLRWFSSVYAELDRQIEKFRELHNSYLAANTAYLPRHAVESAEVVSERSSHVKPYSLPYAAPEY